MPRKKLTLITGTEQTRLTLTKQLQEYLSDMVTIKSYAIDEGIPNRVTEGLVVLSSYLVQEELMNLELLGDGCDIVVAQRTISYDCIDEIVLLPKGREVLFVNDAQASAHEGIYILQKLGVDYLKFTPYFPGMDEVKTDIDIAITPGEIDKVPSFIKKIVDIGPRIMDFTTITKILYQLNLLDYKAEDLSDKYLEKIINMAKRLAQFTNEIAHLNEHLSLVLDGLNDGLLVYDLQGSISVLNENLKRMLKIANSNPTGKNTKEVIYNKALLRFLMDKSIEGDKIFSLDGLEILIRKLYLSNSNHIIATFKSIKETMETNDRIKQELMKKGHYAKYTFEDIIGGSNKIIKVKQIAQKLSTTDLTILIEGESGTGKELFASAIHHASKRKKGPFLAVNFSSLPDELIESELFGYEEGAFTGAKKGGKAGIFEEADGGTIFLDEIGDISMKVQARLLRVLQEKEVMRIGGHHIKSVDVRIIAATNRDLSQMVKEKSFREDLYYRLKMGYMKLPPLRERKEDLQLLIDYFIKIESGESIVIQEDALGKLFKYDWYGNVRELENILSYMLAVRENNHLTIEDIPDKGFFITTSNHGKELEKEPPPVLKEDMVYLLKKIYELNQKKLLVGREKLAEVSKITSYPMTPAQIRGRLDELERLDFIKKKRGKHGTIVTQKGEKYLMALFGDELAL
ncbi:sigma-54 interaction domain-containing protein [Natronincola ferrireducens]|uniref:Transcriptional regulator containing PAS, AAA-type ATPase, and DNA-binding Fis domains n=1 Tax=Natronincola ferrireducens TaxID=393762 RepID=A0A1G8ZXI2_9FIRM|nr:sigma 54-interacting transcriptional regulator [Natronincola ferrireducens]SDK19849.1 Transcriptional regulator containing PAS, AAA-type ATPase, and DNA-binding Fis domains [Natronincola ferrireducens]